MDIMNKVMLAIHQDNVREVWHLNDEVLDHLQSFFEDNKNDEEIQKDNLCEMLEEAVKTLECIDYSLEKVINNIDKVLDGLGKAAIDAERERVRKNIADTIGEDAANYF